MGYALWNSMILCVTFVTCLLSFHDVALTVPPFPSHSMKYSRHFLLKWLSRIFATSYSSSEWISIKGGGVGIWPLIFDSVAGSNSDTWNTGWICHKSSGKPNWNACEELLDVIGYGPRWQWSSFFDGCFVQMFWNQARCCLLLWSWGIWLGDLMWLHYIECWRFTSYTDRICWHGIKS